MGWGWLTNILGAYYGVALRKSWEKCPGRNVLGELGSYSRWIRLELLGVAFRFAMMVAKAAVSDTSNDYCSM